MKDLKSIKLTKLDRVRLEERKMSYLVGGRVTDFDCNCACYYANSGGSSTDDNRAANIAGKLSSFTTVFEFPAFVVKSVLLKKK